MQLSEKIKESVDFLSNKGISTAEIGIILGTGLGSLVDHISIIEEVSYSNIPHFPTSTVEFHEGKLVYGTIEGKKVLAMQGRFHFYEGYNMKEVTFPLYVFKKIGIEQLIISNAAGNLNSTWKKGELMLINDHIDLLPENPLRGENDSKMGPRFPDMLEPYSRNLNDKVKLIAKKNKIALREGVYVAVQGPNLETRAEYRYLRTIGADAIGMSTVPEVIVAKYLNIPLCALSVLTDDCDPDNLKPVDINEIIALAKQAEVGLTQIITNLIKEL